MSGAIFLLSNLSNLFVPSLGQFDPSRHLSRQHVSFVPGGGTLKVVWSKTIQFQERDLVIPLPRIPNAPLCPSQALMLVCQLCPMPSPACPVFMSNQGPGQKALTYSCFLAHLKRLLGLDSAQFAGHSFRSGGWGCYICY